MGATILKVNYKRGFAVFLRDDGEYGWLEILDTTELETDELVYGDFYSLGGTTIKKQTGETVDIFIQDFCSLRLATKMAFENT